MNEDLKEEGEHESKVEVSDRWNSKCKGPSVGVCLACMFRALEGKGEVRIEVRRVT